MEGGRLVDTAWVVFFLRIINFGESWGAGGAYSFVPCLSRMTINRASLARCQGLAKSPTDTGPYDSHINHMCHKTGVLGSRGGHRSDNDIVSQQNMDIVDFLEA